ncbi:hypothetical protein [Pedobacter caeni]|uniref:Uncharacterized protein n=1 Tax=Pedobacter caeni TaxID=288992 RepID=A0A1M5HIM4_9SPHI|nr:hypothetical protein [Pedobacter caeni]SHG15751.1 hypothetical protein SAMN04488522_104678 [Pedobacter caeni]
MRIISDIKEANELLSLYIGATLQVFMFSTSLLRMALKLTVPGNPEAVFIVGISCTSIEGQFALKNSNVSIVTEINKEFGETITSIIDKSGNFKLITSGGFAIAQGLEEEFRSSFDSFIKE